MFFDLTNSKITNKNDLISIVRVFINIPIVLNSQIKQYFGIKIKYFYLTFIVIYYRV